MQAGQQKDLKKAIHYIGEMIAVEPESSEARSLRGRLRAELDDYEGAFKDFEDSRRLARTAHEYGIIMLRQGWTHRRQKDYEQALKCFDEAHRLIPDDIDTLECRAATQRTIKHYELAILDYLTILQNPDLSTFQRACTLMQLGITRSMAEDYAGARRELDQAAQLMPRMAAVYFNHALVDFREKAYSSAKDNLDKVIALEPKQAIGFANRGLVYMQLREFDRASSDFDETLCLQPDHAFTYANRGYMFGVQGDQNKALSDCQMAIEKGAEYPCVYGAYAHVLLMFGQFDAAMENFNKQAELAVVTQEEDEQSSAKEGQACVHFVRGEREVAIALWRDLMTRKAYYSNYEAFEKHALYAQSTLDVVKQIVIET